MCINKSFANDAYDECQVEMTFTRNQGMKNELQTESLRQLLLAQKVQLIDKMIMDRGGASTRADAAMAQLSAVEQSHAQNMSERDIAFAIQEHDVLEIEAIELALQRIACGEYGQCHACAAEIPITRLLAFPAAMRCVACQTAEEKLAGPNAAFH
jgi:DnaK suppressor protein